METWDTLVNSLPQMTINEMNKEYEKISKAKIVCDFIDDFEEEYYSDSNVYIDYKGSEIEITLYIEDVFSVELSSNKNKLFEICDICEYITFGSADVGNEEYSLAIMFSIKI